MEPRAQQPATALLAAAVGVLAATLVILIAQGRGITGHVAHDLWSAGASGMSMMPAMMGSMPGMMGAPAGTYDERNAVVISGDAATVEIKNLQFGMQGIKVKAGTTVTWVNRDPIVHNVSEVNGAFVSPHELRPGDSFAFTFDKPGVYRYVCTFHQPGMSGVVIVEG